MVANQTEILVIRKYVEFGMHYPADPAAFEMDFPAADFQALNDAVPALYQVWRYY